MAAVLQPLEPVRAALRSLSITARRAEEVALTVVLVAMVALPLLDRLLLEFDKGFGYSNALVQHLTLALSMLGGALAAREYRLIALAALADHLPGPWKAIGQSFGRGVATAVALLLARAGDHFVTAERDAGGFLLPHVPLWLVDCVIPLGFVLIALRLVRSREASWLQQLGSALVALVLLTVFSLAPCGDTANLVLGAVALTLALLAGAPMFTIIGGCALLALWTIDLPSAIAAVKHYSLATTPVVPSIPLFTLAGYILAEGGASRRLVRLFEALFAHLPGGLAIAAVIVCAFFTSFTGASGVTIVALGGLLMPVLMATGYSQRHALGMVTGSGAIGLLFPPCVPVILYSIVAQQALEGFDPDALATHDISIENMFAGAFLPGVILLILVALWGATRRRVQSARPRFNGREALRAIWAAKWELLMPVVAVGALLGGFVSSPVQAAALTVLYAFLVEFVLYRDLDWRRDLTRISAQSGLLIGGILLILGVALGLTHALVAAQVPEKLIDWVTSTVHSPLVFLLALNVLLVIVGGLMEVYCAIVVVVPLIVPLGLQFGVDPVHLGVIILANLELGFLTPPVGLNLLLASSRFDRPMSEVVRASLPLFGVQALGVLLITYWPALTTTLPRLLAH